tara:strand:- start:2816 stop:3112 length:297 start_codon:yes stop_codon:yes gene_type:complete
MKNSTKKHIPNKNAMKAIAMLNPQILVNPNNRAGRRYEARQKKKQEVTEEKIKELYADILKLSNELLDEPENEELRASLEQHVLEYNQKVKKYNEQQS